MTSKKQHWENVYQNKTPQEVSWTQAKPQTSLDFITSFNLEKMQKSLTLVVVKVCL